MLNRSLYVAWIFPLALTILQCTKVVPSHPAADTAPTGPQSEGTKLDSPALFENPGGMWMPQQMQEHAEILKSLGLEIDPSTLGQLTGYPMGAIVSLGFCSGSFVSPDGLIVTNHHCAGRALQYISTTGGGELVTELGWLARDRSREKSAGPSQRIFVTAKFEDVTPQVVGGLDGISDPVKRYLEAERRIKKLVSECEKPGETRCQVAGFYERRIFYRFEQLELRDIRLVYAPHEGIGYFGGEVDNWHWPRHTGDYSFLRAYVGPDGKPASFSPNNIPYRPGQFLRLASKPLETNDFVMVAGYPGATSRLKTGDEAKEAVEWYYPFHIQRFNEHIELLEKITHDDEALKNKVKDRLDNHYNYRTNFQDVLKGLIKGDLVGKKLKLESDLQNWIESDPLLKAKYGHVIEKLKVLRAQYRKHLPPDSILREIVPPRFASLLAATVDIVRMAKERPKPDAERLPEYQERNWPALRDKLSTLTKLFDRRTDLPLNELILQRAMKLKEEDRPKALLMALTGEASPTSDSIHTALEKLYAGTSLEESAPENKGLRLKLFNEATEDQLANSPDTFIKAALSVVPIIEEMELRDKAYLGESLLLTPLFISALQAYKEGTPIASDANGTLRISYGIVRGYKPDPDVSEYKPFTVLSEMMAKYVAYGHQFPFYVPSHVRNAFKAKAFGPYVDTALGEVPVNFLANLDITGGNSGSATLNAKGELVGLVFDGNSEGVASTWMFQPDITRSIHVDMRYPLWIMDAAEDADHLLKEMGITPAIDE